MVELSHAHQDYLRFMITGPVSVNSVREHVFGPDWHNAFAEYWRVENDLIQEGLAIFQCWSRGSKCVLTAKGETEFAASSANKQ